jgi:molecular chaperone GrpE
MQQEEPLPNENIEEKLTQEQTDELIYNIENATENEGNSEQTNPSELEITTLKAQLEEQKDKYLRLYADFDNFKKRNAKERLDLIQTAAKDTIISMLPVLDDFERAIKASENLTDVAQAREGLSLIYQKMLNTLQQKGLKSIETIGEEFNVEQHEALTEIPAPTPEIVGKVVDQVEKGYYLNDKIIRFAKVVVGKKID